MNRKILTIFAVLALLVVAMAGTAFAAAGDVTDITLHDGERNNVCVLEPIDSYEYEASAYYISCDKAPDLVFFANMVFDNPGIGSFISADVSNGAIFVDYDLDDCNGETSADIAVTISDWDLDDGILITGLGIYDADTGDVIGEAISIDIAPDGTFVSFDVAAVTATAASSVAPDDVTFVLYLTDVKEVPIGMPHLFIGIEIDADVPIENGVFNFAAADDYISVDLVDIADSNELAFAVGDFGPGAAGTVTLKLMASEISADLYDNHDNYIGQVYIAGVSDNVLAELKVEIEEGALKVDKSSFTFTRGTAVDGAKAKISADVEIDDIEFYVISDDGKLEPVEDGDVLKAFTISIGEFDTSGDFGITFDENYATSYDMAFQVSADLGGKNANARIYTSVVDPATSFTIEDFLAMIGTGQAANLHVGANVLYPLAGGWLVNPEDPAQVVTGGMFTFQIWFLTAVGGEWAFDPGYDGDLLCANMYGGLYEGDLEAGDVWTATDEHVAFALATVQKSCAEFSFDSNGFTASGIRGTDIVVVGNYHYAVFDSADVLVINPADLHVIKAGNASGGSGVGCDAGFGALALLGLAGFAAILRKKH